MLTLAKWFAALAAGVMLLLFAAFWWVARENLFAPTPAQGVYLRGIHPPSRIIPDPIPQQYPEAP
jgi:hypothetical protein